MLFLDAATYLSRYKLNIPLERYVQVDIDDVFVGRTTTRMTENDVNVSVITYIYVAFVNCPYPCI